MALDSDRRAEIRDSAGNTCAFCGSPDRLEVHHIVPVAEGGSDKRENLAVVCKSCHHTMEGMTRRLREKIPRQDQETIERLRKQREQLVAKLTHARMQMWSDGYPWEMINDIFEGKTALDPSDYERKL